MDINIRAINHERAGLLEADAATSLFWELPPAEDGSAYPSEDPRFDKQLWLQRVLYEWGICGYTAFVESGDSGCNPVAAATVFFAPPSYFPGAEQLPTGPVSPDAILISAVHVALPYMGLYLEHQLIDTVLTEAHRRGVKAIEAFARMEDLEIDIEGHGDALSELEYIPEAYRGWEAPRGTHTGDLREDRLSVAPMLSEDILEAEGFKLVKHHRRYPRYRFEIPAQSNMFACHGETEHEKLNGSPALSTVTGGGLLRNNARVHIGKANQLGKARHFGTAP